MSISGLCQICESAPAVHRCERCGALVCEEHFDPDLAMCTDCAAQVRQSRGPDGEGGDTYRF